MANKETSVKDLEGFVGKKVTVKQLNKVALSGILKGYDGYHGRYNITIETDTNVRWIPYHQIEDINYEKN